LTYIAVAIDVTGSELRSSLRSVDWDEVVLGEFLIVTSVRVEPGEFTREPSVDTASTPVRSSVAPETTAVDPTNGLVSPSLIITGAVKRGSRHNRRAEENLESTEESQDEDERRRHHSVSGDKGVGEDGRVLVRCGISKLAKNVVERWALYDTEDSEVKSKGCWKRLT